MKKIHQTKDVIRHTLHYVSGKTLDLGAGTAKYRWMIEPKTTSYTTFDAVPGAGIDVVGDVLDAPFAGDSFDTVISTQVLEHVEKPWVMVREINRILKKGGFCILTAPFLVPYHADPHDYFRYTTEGLKSLFKNSGFEIAECSGYGSTYATLSEIIHFVYFNPYTKKPLTWSERILRYINKVAAFLDKYTRNSIVYPNTYIVAKKV